MELQTYSRSIFAWECDYGMVDLKSSYNVKITRASVLAAPQIECQPGCRLVLRPEHRPVCHKCLAVRLCKNECHPRYRSEVLHTHRQVCLKVSRPLPLLETRPVSRPPHCPFFAKCLSLSLLFRVSDLV